MATYVISDIHGMYSKFIELLNKIKLKDTDTLHILGDVLDRVIPDLDTYTDRIIISPSTAVR